jgi:hypothetical protein
VRIDISYGIGVRPTKNFIAVKTAVTELSEVINYYKIRILNDLYTLTNTLNNYPRLKESTYIINMFKDDQNFIVFYASGNGLDVKLRDFFSLKTDDIPEERLIVGYLIKDLIVIEKQDRNPIRKIDPDGDLIKKFFELRN